MTVQPCLIAPFSRMREKVPEGRMRGASRFPSKPKTPKKEGMPKSMPSSITY
ncbi:hypothetical protein D3C81_2012250 [compost metagenome]